MSVPPSFHLLPSRLGGAAENMAIDFLLLQRYPDSSQARFRHYGWHRPACTFGYSQKFAFIRDQLASDSAPTEICRRFTGGGLVDHREDWTYALVIPRGHPIEAGRAVDCYRDVHEALAAAMRELGQPAETKKPGESSAPSSGQAAAGVCFSQAEYHDVIVPGSGVKIAGAAQKRNKHGLILQGSIWRPSAGKIRNWEDFLAGFVERLGRLVQAAPEETPWPDFNDNEVEQLTATYASDEWNQQR